MKKKVLLYYPPNKRSVAIETLCRAVKDAGHELIVLTLTEKDSFHQQMEKMGFATFTTVMDRKPSWKYFLNKARYLIRFCKEHKIDYVWSHLQEANIIAVMSQQFMRAKVVTFRHHAESAFYAEYGQQFGMQRNKNEVLFDKIINRLAKKIVVPSSGVWYGMEKYEGCDMRKVKLLPYIYDFTTYQQPDPEKVKLLKDDNPCQLRLIMVSRMVPTKQHMPVFQLVKKLVAEGLSIKMIVMDDGPLKPELETFIRENKLAAVIDMVGFRSDFINFMAAADLLIHPSLTEASNNVVKELALLEKGVAVCKDVGDFNDYIRDGQNGFMIDRGNLVSSLEGIIRTAYAGKERLEEMGKELKKDVLDMFSNAEKNRKRFIDLIEN
ncbi:MAG: glycosyltransferase family 4 protein [Chitinophagaceae bacterium]|nr:glycosyltransferase family 4 protein [Chitinophagaceae bacterium]